MQIAVVLINVFEVPAVTEREFIAWWKDCTEALKKEPGFIDAKLHHSLKSDARFQFINVAHWATKESLDLALARNTVILQAIPAGKGNPALYAVELQY